MIDTHIYMVRHAESVHIHGEERSRGLTEEGLLHAKYIADLFANIQVDVVVSSPYERAIQTVQYIAAEKGLNIQEYEDLRERPIKGLNYKETWDVIVEAIRVSFDDKDYALQGGETTNQARERSVPTLELLLEQYEGKHVVIGTHGNIMTIMMNYYHSKYDYHFWEQTSKPDIYHLIFRDKKLTEVNRLWKDNLFLS
ncbi:histidine phosphatase family protein [Paenibacillus sp. Marseille-Q4541]|uniref:histidine phosphatase family protein n=1 Tax=Paenibacillus sp. Marseille-Q4541 TaxID=2831522 RepID=UPI0020197DB3|nr:histidine phosphatase family protein [Paenibacillus sp. Marseille-Q4541]